MVSLLMIQWKEIGLTFLLLGTPVFMAAALLFMRDRLTFRADISREERNQITETRSLRAINGWHLFTFLCACVSLPFNLANIGHQQARSRVAEAIVAIVVIFWYYRKRSEIRVQNPGRLRFPPIN
jgi:hypothetical protein